MNKVMGILLLLVYVCAASALLSEAFIKPYNMQNVVRYSALYGIIGIGVSFVIITGGIDLSIGSLIGLTGCLLPMLLVTKGWSIPAAVTAVMGVALLLGLGHGLLITKVRLQPFIVTLCGLLIYRGVARWITGDRTQGFGSAYDDSLRLLAIGKPCSLALLILIGGVLATAWSGWSWWRGRAGDSSPQVSSAHAWAGLVIGVTLIVIGSSRYWPGIVTESGAFVISFGPLNVLTWGGGPPRSAAELPQLLMNWTGLGILPALFWLTTVTCRHKPQRMMLPFCAVVLGGLLVKWATLIVAQPDEWFWLGPPWASRWRMAAVFVSLGLLMAAIGWLYRRSLKVAGSAAWPPLLLSGYFGGLWLLGKTPLGEMLVPAPFLFLILLATFASLFLNQTIYGRYLLALGKNEEAARYSGINTDRMVILAYVLCAGASGIGGILFALDGNSVQPAGHGSFLELYAIAAAVLGGCSLRGGEGSILGVIIGAAVMRVLYNSINILGIPSQLEFAIIGVVILFGVLADELVKRIAARRKPAVPESPFGSEVRPVQQHS